MVLYFDLGNTRIKWCADLAGGGAREYGFLERKMLSSEMKRIQEELPEDSVNEILVASVSSEEENREFSKVCETVFAVRAQFANVESPFNGLVAAYKELTAFGVDRWLALLSVHLEFGGPALVIDAGSALTADYLGEDGAHLGGFIAPGMSSLMHSLKRDTSMVSVAPSQKEFGHGRAPGRSTAQCVESGLNAMFHGFLRTVLDELPFESISIVIAGGDLQRVKKSVLESLVFRSSPVKADVYLRPNIVIDGLIKWCSLK